MAPENSPEQPFRWEDLDQRILSFKTNEIANEMHRRIEEARRRIGFETAQKHNIGAYWPELMAFHEKLADEWAQRVYEAHCETWLLQGRTVTPGFIRAVRDRPIAQLFAARRSSVVGQMGNWHRRTGQTFNSALADSWAMAMDRMAARWHQKLEAEAATAEHSIRRSAAPSVLSEILRDTSMPASWGSLYQAFTAMSQEERGVALGRNGNRLLTAFVDYRDPDLKIGDWSLNGGITETFKSRFVVLAMHAARAFRANHPEGHLLHIWLHNIYQDLLRTKSDLLFAATEEGGMITRVCEASALYCLRLQTKKLQEDPSPEDLPVTEKPKKNLRKSGPAPLRPADFVSFAGKLWRQLKARSVRLDGQGLLEIASRLDEKEYVPPTAYLEGTIARELKAFNSKNAHSKSGAIMTWTRLVKHGDKDHVRGMRRMLSRCASKRK
jgi:hypothetical protein